jgi:hypothetical protein
MVMSELGSGNSSSVEQLDRGRAEAAGHESVSSARKGLAAGEYTPAGYAHQQPSSLNLKPVSEEQNEDATLLLVGDTTGKPTIREEVPQPLETRPDESVSVTDAAGKSGLASKTAWKRDSLPLDAPLSPILQKKSSTAATKPGRPSEEETAIAKVLEKGDVLEKILSKLRNQTSEFLSDLAKKNASGSLALLLKDDDCKIDLEKFVMKVKEARHDSVGTRSPQRNATKSKAASPVRPGSSLTHAKSEVVKAKRALNNTAAPGGPTPTPAQRQSKFMRLRSRHLKHPTAKSHAGGQMDFHSLGGSDAELSDGDMGLEKRKELLEALRSENRRQFNDLRKMHSEEDIRD